MPGELVLEVRVIALKGEDDCTQRLCQSIAAVRYMKPWGRDYT
jgi:hypothetical protein